MCTRGREGGSTKKPLGSSRLSMYLMSCIDLMCVTHILPAALNNTPLLKAKHNAVLWNTVLADKKLLLDMLNE